MSEVLFLITNLNPDENLIIYEVNTNCHLFTKFASYKVPPVMVSTQGSVVPLAMFAFVFVFVFIVAVFIMTVVSPMGNSQTQKLFALNNIKISTCNISSAVSAP